MKKIDAEEEEDLWTACRKVSILKLLQRRDHPCIVRLLDVATSGLVFSLALECMECDLSVCIKRPMSEERIKKFAAQLIEGVDYCHSHSIIHRDLKPANLLIDVHDNLKLADFGLAKEWTYPQQLTRVVSMGHVRPMTDTDLPQVVTLWWRAPELILHDNKGIFGFEIDMWSVGAIFVEMWTGKVVFQGMNEIDQLGQIFRNVSLVRHRKPATDPGE